VTGKITRILDRGAVVEIRHDVEGFVPVGQMGMEDIQHPEQYFVIGEEIPLRVIKVDPKNKRIVLSVTAYLKTRDEEEVRVFLDKHPKKDIVIPVPSGDAIDDVDADLIAGAEEALES
jgi:small subunit ribosomal protein S1